MHDRCVDRHQEIEMREHRGGVGVAFDLRCEIDDLVGGEAREIAGALADLQRIEPNARHIEDRSEAVECDRAAAVARVLGIACPGDANLQPAACAGEPA
jgi:hypothetical protein